MFDLDKVYKKDHNENVKLFSDLKSKQKYSLYSTGLNKYFGDNSYDIFYKDLLTHKKIQINYFKKMFEKPVNKGGFKKYEKPFNIKEFNVSLKNMELKQNELEDKMKQARVIKSSPYKLYLQMLNKSKKQKKKVVLPEIPDIGRYNPNYESIRTHSSLPAFASTDFTNYNKYKNNVNAHHLSLIKDKEKENKSYILNKSENKLRAKSLTEHYETDQNYNNISIDKSQSQSFIKNNDLNNSQYISTSSFGDEKNNHCLKFDSYSPRKPMINPDLNTTEFNSKSTDYYPIRNIKGNIDFNKISSNPHICSYFEEIAKKHNSPPLGMYKPNYNSIFKKPVVDIYLNKRDPPPPKLIKLKKMMYNYKVPTQYEMFSILNDYKKD